MIPEPSRDRPTVLHCLWQGGVGGSERAVYLLARAQMRGSAFAPALMYAARGGRYWELAHEIGCPVTTLDVPSGRAAWRLQSVAGAMRGHDVLHFHGPEPLLMGAAILRRSAARVFTRRGGLPGLEFKKRVSNALVGAALRTSFHGVSGNTEHAARCAADVFGLDPGAVQVTYNGLDFAALEPVRPGPDVRSELGLQDRDFVLGTTANLKRLKRIDSLLPAVAALGPTGLRLVVVGEGEDRTRLEHLIAEQGLGSYVIFAGQQAVVGDYLQVMDAFCLPTDGRESFGNAVVEAMSRGIPTFVFADGGGTLEHIEHGRTGWVVEEPTGAVELLAEIRNDHTRRTEVGEAGRTAVLERYTMQRSVEAYDELYRRAVTKVRR